MTPTDHELLELQARALFTHNADGRIVSKNKPVYAPAPRLFLGRSLAGNLWRFRDDVPDDLTATLEPLLLREPVMSCLDALPIVQTELIAELARHQPIAEIYSGPAWRFPDEMPATRRAVPVTTADAGVLRPNYPILAEHLPVMSPCVVIIDAGMAVSVCFSARISPQVAEAGLDTVVAARGRGYGPDVVAVWAAAVRAAGQIPLYSTSWDNVASRRVAEKLGLVQYGVDVSIY